MIIEGDNISDVYHIGERHIMMDHFKDKTL